MFREKGRFCVSVIALDSVMLGFVMHLCSYDGSLKSIPHMELRIRRERLSASRRRLVRRFSYCTGLRRWALPRNQLSRQLLWKSELCLSHGPEDQDKQACREERERPERSRSLTEQARSLEGRAGLLSSLLRFWEHGFCLPHSPESRGERAHRELRPYSAEVSRPEPWTQ